MAYITPHSRSKSALRIPLPRSSDHLDESYQASLEQELHVFIACLGV